LWRIQRCTGTGPRTWSTAARSAFAAVGDDQDALVDVQAASDQVGEQVPGHGGVLRRAVPQPQRQLDAVGRDAERDDAAAALELDPVEHQRSQADVAEVAGS